MKLSNDMKSNLDKQLSAFIACLSSQNDIRRCFSILPTIAFPVSALLDISYDPSDMFVGYLITQMLSLVQGIYDGNSNTWYELNKENVQNLRTSLSNYAEDLKRDINNDDEEGVINASKTFFSKFHRLARETSQDVRHSP